MPGKKTLRTAALFALLLLAPLAARAALTCQLSAAGAAFGGYDSIAVQDRDTIGSITVTCSGTAGDQVTYSIQLSPGSGSYTGRSASNGTASVAYNLYVDGARTQVWGDGTAGTSTVSDSYALDSTMPVSRTYNIYGRIPGNQSFATTGVYSDTVAVTLIY